jgi:hypothetical protein
MTGLNLYEQAEIPQIVAEIAARMRKSRKGPQEREFSWAFCAFSRQFWCISR